MTEVSFDSHSRADGDTDIQSLADYNNSLNFDCNDIQYLAETQGHDMVDMKDDRDSADGSSSDSAAEWDV